MWELLQAAEIGNNYCWRNWYLLLLHGASSASVSAAGETGICSCCMVQASMCKQHFCECCWRNWNLLLLHGPSSACIVHKIIREKVLQIAACLDSTTTEVLMAGSTGLRGDATLLIDCSR